MARFSTTPPSQRWFLWGGRFITASSSARLWVRGSHPLRPLVQRIEHPPSKRGIKVRFLEGRLYTVLWCNGSTGDFGSLCLGSNPCKTIFSKSGGMVYTTDLKSVAKRLAGSSPASCTFGCVVQRSEHSAHNGRNAGSNPAAPTFTVDITYSS